MAVSAEQYAQQLANLLPPGAALASEPGSEMAELLARLGVFLAAAHNRAEQLLDEAYPWHALELLPEWEASLGLPDNCSAAPQTLQQRRAALVARLVDTGGARIHRFIRIAEVLGYPDATTHRFREHTAEVTCEDPICERDWRFYWRLCLPNGVLVEESNCESGAEDPLRWWGNTELECVMHRECPQPSTVLISYGGE